MKTYSAIIRSLALIINVFALTVGVSPHARAAGKQLLVGNAADNSVSSYDGTTGVFLQIFVPSGSGGLDTPQDLTIGPDGNLYVSSWANHSVKRYDGQTGAFIDDFVPSRSGGLANPDQVVFGPDGKLYVSSRFNATISRYDGQTGAFVDTFVADSRLSGFVGFTFGPDGNIYAGMFNCCGNQQILRFNGTTGAFMNVFNSGGPPLDSAFAGLVFGPDGHLYASRYHADTIERYNGTTGAFIDTFVPAGSGGLNTPDYLTFGPDGNLYVASLSTGNILRYDGTTGTFINVFTSGGGVLSPKGLIFFTPATAPVGGAVSGISPEKGMVVCRNLTTHEAVRIPLDAATSWNCEDAGLVVSPGDQIKIQLQIIGTAQ
jgi:DNA-binding beta-propeller fold protein YncE